MKYFGKYGGADGKRVKGPSTVAILYVVFSPGTPVSTVVEWRLTKPYFCNVNDVCTFVGSSRIIDRYDGSSTPGEIEGVARISAPMEDMITVIADMKMIMTFF